MKLFSKKPLLFLSVLTMTFLLLNSCAGEANDKNLNPDSNITKISNPDSEGKDLKIADVEELKVTSIAFESDSHNFGEISKGDAVEHTFNFTNTGTEDLKIVSVKPSCKCTVAGYSKESIAPGAKGYVTVGYDGSGQGVFKKSATVIANTDPKAKILNITGEVVN